MENELQKQERRKRDIEIRRLYPRLTMREIGNRYGISYERVRQILEKWKTKS